eukprot:Seg1340.11 transcript_id=Seg1340.11/GoldUCD/mRNA.D3Y31 product="hypothetical protein" protein_id=Seg1340.11/GoldUCD/D3Y31
MEETDDLPLQKSKETIKLLDFAKSVTENIKCALAKTSKPTKKKMNHKKYIQRKCFTKPTPSKRPSRRSRWTEDTKGPSLVEEGAMLPEEIRSFQEMLDRESEKFYMAYLQAREYSENTQQLIHEENYAQVRWMHHSSYHSSTNAGASTPQNEQDNAAINTCTGRSNGQYPPKLTHFDFEPVYTNDQWQRGTLSDESFLSVLHAEVSKYQMPSTTPKTNTENVSNDAYYSKEHDAYHSNEHSLGMTYLMMPQ